jgi:hypothetical protein
VDAVTSLASELRKQASTGFKGCVCLGVALGLSTKGGWVWQGVVLYWIQKLGLKFGWVWFTYVVTLYQALFPSASFTKQACRNHSLISFQEAIWQSCGDQR